MQCKRGDTLTVGDGNQDKQISSVVFCSECGMRILPNEPCLQTPHGVFCSLLCKEIADVQIAPLNKLRAKVKRRRGRQGGRW